MVHSQLRGLRSSTPRWAAICIVMVTAQCAGMRAFADADIDRIKVAAEHGFVHDEVALGEAYFAGKGVAQDLQKAAHWYQKAAGAGDPLAMNQLGYLYQTGMGVRADLGKAVHWYQLAAASGLTRAKVNLGVTYLFGLGVAKSPDTADKLFEEAARAGDSTACAYLGDMYAYGVGLAKDSAKAAQWYEQGVKLHDFLAEYRVGISLLESHETAELRRALQLLRASAGQGYVPAMHSAALLMINHPELAQSHEEEIAYLTEASDAGMWQSSAVLGVLARDGGGEPQSDRKAYALFRVAAGEGGESANAMLRRDIERLKARLSAGQIAEADVEVAAWLRQHPRALLMVYKGKDPVVSSPLLALAIPQEGIHAGIVVPSYRGNGRKATP